MSLVEKVTRKSLKIRPSGRSTDFISPSFGHGCLYNCSYCYMKRHKPEGLSIATNTMDILTEINSHVWFADVEKPNQTGDFITYDISCNEDFALNAKYHDWKTIFKFFRDHPRDTYVLGNEYYSSYRIHYRLLRTKEKTMKALIIIILFILIDTSTVVEGKASYYGQHWTGRLTASGERFYADSLTCAHKTYRFGTILKVTDLRNDSIIYVKVNDRLPKSSKYLVDLSYGCAKKLDFIRTGVIPVTLEIVDTVKIIKK